MNEKQLHKLGFTDRTVKEEARRCGAKSREIPE